MDRVAVRLPEIRSYSSDSSACAPRNEPLWQALVFESDENQQRFGYSRADICPELRSCADYRFFAIEREGGFTALGHDGAGPEKRADSVLAVTKARYDTARFGPAPPAW